MTVYIHALREEGDSFRSSDTDGTLSFLSTPSARRATRDSGQRITKRMDFYPRPPRGGRRLTRRHPAVSNTFLSTPSARRATLYLLLLQQVNIFLSTPSARRATAPTPHRARGRSISIHALREEGDLSAPEFTGPQVQFLSTPSARRATDPDRRTHTRPCISIHALREEGDSERCWGSVSG